MSVEILYLFRECLKRFKVPNKIFAILLNNAIEVCFDNNVSVDLSWIGITYFQIQCII